MRSKSTIIVLMSVVMLSLAPIASAAFNFYEPESWNVGDTGSTYQQWDFFTANSGNTPDVGANNPNGTATVDVLWPGFVTGSGNFYSFLDGYDFGATIDVPNGTVSAYGTHIILQLNTGLNEGVGILNGTTVVEGATQTATLLRDDVLFEGDVYVPVMGFDVTYQERILEFWLPETGNFTISWGEMVDAPINEIRVDSMVNYTDAFDITPVEFVPEPATMSLLAAGGVMCLLRREGEGRMAMGNDAPSGARRGETRMMKQ